jgi:nucleoside-diphosphate kinase
MTVEFTLSIIKPDAIKKGHLGKIIDRFEKADLKAVAMKMVHLTEDEAKEFYAEHQERPFYNDLVNFMSSGPCVVQILQGEEAISKNREIMGATNPDNAEEGTIRYDFARPVEDLSENAVHGSDSVESAAREITFFFEGDKISNRGGCCGTGSCCCSCDS